MQYLRTVRSIPVSGGSSRHGTPKGLPIGKAGSTYNRTQRRFGLFDTSLQGQYMRTVVQSLPLFWRHDHLARKQTGWGVLHAESQRKQIALWTVRAGPFVVPNKRWQTSVVTNLDKSPPMIRGLNSTLLSDPLRHLKIGVVCDLGGRHKGTHHFFGG